MRKKLAVWLSLLCLCIAMLAFGITACDDGKEDAPQLTGIAITTQPDKTEYTEGETFDPTGMVVEAQYDDQTHTAVTDYTYAPNGALKVSDTAITVTYKGKTATQAITVAPKPAVEKIEITQMPDKVNYFTGDTFDRTGMVVTAYYDNDTTAVVEDYATNYTTLNTSGEIRIVVTYEGCTANFTVTVTDPVLSSIEIVTPPDIVLYNVGDVFDPTGMEVVAHYENDKVVPLDAEAYTYDYEEQALTEDVKQITVTYTENDVTKTATVEITVMELVATGIVVVQQPDVTEYSIGEVFNSAGLMVYAVYNDDDTLTRPVSGWTIKEAGVPLTSEDEYVTVAWQEFTARIEIDVFPVYRFEAEALGYIAKDGVDTKLRRGMEYGSAASNCTAETVSWSSVSGTGFLNNYSTADAITLEVTAQNAVNVSIILNLASHAANVGDKQYVSGILYSVEVNGTEYSVDPNAATVRRENSLRYMDFQDVVIMTGVPFVAGNNTIKFNFTGNYNFDYVGIRCAEEIVLTAEKDTGHSWTEWTVTQVPTAESAGSMYRYCPVCFAREQVELPANLNDTSVYTLEGSTAATAYLAGTATYEYDGKTFTVITEEAKGGMLESVYDFEDAVMDKSFNEKYGIFDSGLDSTANRDIHGAGAQKFNDGGGRFTWTVYASADATVTLAVRLARNTTRYLNPAFNLRLCVNGEYIALDDSNYLTNVLSSGGVSYFDWVYVECGTFNVKAGKNTITIEALAAPFTNVDDVKLISAAHISASEAGTIVSAQITKAPDKTDYMAGERFNPEGMTVTVTYKDNSTQQFNGYYVDTSTPLTAEDTYVSVYVGGIELRQNITVTAVTSTLERLEITKNPDKTVYKEGESFDATGLAISAVYSDGNSVALAIEDLEIDAPEVLSGGQATITISYNGKQVQLDIDVLYKSVFEAEALEYDGTDLYRLKEWDAENITAVSGEGYLANWSTAGTHFTLKVWNPSESAVSADMVFCFGQTTKSNNFSAITLNGDGVELKDYSMTVDGYFSWTETPVAATLNLQPGENTIVFTISAKANFDYIALYASQKILLYAEKDGGHSFTDWTVYHTPTAEEGGMMYRYCPVCSAIEFVELPADLGNTDIYTKVSSQAATQYVRGTATYTYDGMTFTVTEGEATGESKDNIFQFEHAQIVRAAESKLYTKETGGDAISVGIHQKGADATFNVYSSEAATVYLVIRGGAVNKRDIYYSRNMRLLVNGKYMGMDYDANIAARSSDAEYPSYFEWGDTVVAVFELQKGENSIVISWRGGQLTNVDYITLRSVADIRWDYNGIAANKAPDKTVYAEGEKFESAGMEIVECYAVTDEVFGFDGEAVITSGPVEGWTVDNAEEPLAAGTEYVTVRYGEMTCKVPVTVNGDEGGEEGGEQSGDEGEAELG